MGYNHWLLFLAIWCIMPAAALLSNIKLPEWCVALWSMAAVAIIGRIWWILRATISRTITGFDLLKSQDTSNTLAPVGDKGADRIVSLFNALLTTLRAERLLLKEQSHFVEMLIAMNPVGIARLDLDGRFDTVNPAFTSFTGCHADDIKGRGCDALPEIWSQNFKSLDIGQSLTIRGEGNQVWRLWRLAYQDRGFRRQFFMIERLTDEILAAERQMYNKVVRVMAHEVNNTMAGLLPLLQILTDTTADAEIVAALKICTSRTQELSQFIDRYAELARIPQPKCAPIAIDEFIEESLPILRTTAGEGIALKAAHDGPRGHVNADRALLRHALINIVKNAAESIKKTQRIDGEIIIATTAHTLTISDNGAGLSDGAKQNIFSPFFTDKPGGSGIGLMFVAEVLSRQKATFTLTPSHPQGATFYIKFKS